MNKAIKSQIQRGKTLDDDCRKANITTHEYGMDDNRVFCFGLYEETSESEIRKKCAECSAFVLNAEPPGC